MRVKQKQRAVITCVYWLAVTLIIVTLAACTKRETEYPTAWLRIHLLRPRTGDSGVIRLGSRKEIYEFKRGGRWTKIGDGNYSAYMLLGEGTAALINLSDGQHLVRPDAAPRSVPLSFGRAGSVSVPSSEGTFVDVFVEDAPNRASIYRYDLDGSERAHFQVSVPDAFSDCRLGTVVGYDGKSLPYVAGNCKHKSPQAKCVMVAPHGFIHVIPPERDYSECGTLAVPGVSVVAPAQFLTFH